MLSLSDGIAIAEAVGRIYETYQQLEPASKAAIVASIEAVKADETLASADWDAVKPDVDLIITTLKGTPAS